jgi:hypothetical protein
MLGKFPGNESFKNEMASPLSKFCMFHFSVSVKKKLLKELAMFFGSFNFHCSQGRRESFLLDVFFLSLYNVPRCFDFITRFCYKSTVVLLLSFFYNFFFLNWTLLNAMCLCFWIIVVLSEGVLDFFYVCMIFLFFV